MGVPPPTACTQGTRSHASHPRAFRTASNSMPKGLAAWLGCLPHPCSQEHTEAPRSRPERSKGCW